MNFSSFKAVKTANERTNTAGIARGQSFKLKFRKFISRKGGKEAVETSFYISNDKFTELQLAERALIQLVSPEGVAYIATVDNDNGTMMKRTDKLAADAQKGKKFKSTILEDALIKQGVIEDKVGASQMLDLKEVATDQEVAGIHAYQIFEVIKGEDNRTDEEKAAEEADKTETPEESESIPDETVTEETTNAANTEAPVAESNSTPTETEDF